MGIAGNLGFLGYGNMGSAILEGLIQQVVVSPKQVAIYDPAPERRIEAEKLGVAIAESAAGLAARTDVLVLAVKPQAMGAALKDLGDSLGADALVISIAAGISIAYLQERLGTDRRVIRVMPNTPALVKAGAAGFALSATCTEGDAQTARTIFESIGMADQVDEGDIDAVTALSGSGPAYFFYMVESLVKAAVAEGLNEAVATKLAGQTLLGAGMLLRASGDSAAILREKVTSKGGTTEAALRRFGEKGFEDVIAAGVHAAAERSRELGA